MVVHCGLDRVSKSLEVWVGHVWPFYNGQGARNKKTASRRRGGLHYLDSTYENLRQYQTSRRGEAAVVIVIRGLSARSDHCGLPYQKSGGLASANPPAANAHEVIHGADLILDLVLAAVLGGAIGVQRQAAHKPAGFRTHLLVALASCAFAEVGRIAGDDRITANVLTGIGFLGAGVIFRSGLRAHGLTTAASIWTVAAIGVAVGYGQPYALAVGLAVAIITMCVLSFSDRFFGRIFAEHADVKIVCTAAAAACLGNALREFGAHYHPAGQYRVLNSQNESVVEAQFHIVLPRASKLSELVAALTAIPGIREIDAHSSAQGTM